MHRLLHGSGHGDKEEPTIHFVHVFVIVWGGAAVVTVNAQLLRGKMCVIFVCFSLGTLIFLYSSFFQSVCTLGYCLLPLTIAVLLSRVLLTLPVPQFVAHIIRLIVVLIGLIWSVWGELVS